MSETTPILDVKDELQQAEAQAAERGRQSGQKCGAKRTRPSAGEPPSRARGPGTAQTSPASPEPRVQLSTAQNCRHAPAKRLFPESVPQGS